MIKDGKVVKNVMRRFRMSEISVVDRPAQEGARAVIAKRDVEKRLAMTTMADGHAHLIVGLSGGPDGVGELRAGKTSFTDGHQHDWMMDDSGNVIVGDAEGHVHGIAAIVMKNGDVEQDYWKRQFSSKERERLAASGAAMSDGGFPVQNVADLKNALQAFGRAKDKAGVAQHLKRRARTLGLTDQLPKEGRLADLLKKGEDAASTAEDIGGEDMTNKDGKAADPTPAEQLEVLQKRAVRAEKIAELTDAQKEYFKGLGKEDQDRFLALESEGREAELTKVDEANEVVWKDVETGDIYRKNDDPRLVALAKRSHEDRKKRKEMEEKAKLAEVEKIAAELPNLPGEDKDRKALLKSVLALPETERDSILKSLRAQNETLSKTAFSSLGSRSAPKGDGSPESELAVIAKSIREKDPKLTEAQAMVSAMETPEGQALYAKHIGLED